MSDERDHALAECLEDFHRRQARDEMPREGDYRERLGDHYSEFLVLLQAESALDAAIAPPLPTQLPAAFGEYTLLREVGRGAVGVVYEALHRRLGRKVALKVLRTGFDTEHRALERFKREARSCAQVRHDNLVTIFEAGDVEGVPYYSMELLPGAPLSTLIKEGRAPKGRPLYEGLAGVAAGLQTLHDAGIVHRDVKPSNIVVEPGGRMVLTDFGLARTAFSFDLTTTGEAIGTPLYMSPEQMLGKRDEIDGRTDVYGVGATLYEVLAGRPPFKTNDLRELMRMVLTEQPAPLRSLVPGITADVAYVTMTSIEKRKEDRYASARALRDDLLRLAAGEPVLGRPVGPLVRAARRVRRRWVPIAAVLLVLVGAGAYWWTRPGRLVLSTTPPGAEVWVDGVLAGKTPFDREYPAGGVEVRIEHPVFAQKQFHVEIPRGGTADKEVVYDVDAADDLRKAQERFGELPSRVKPWAGRGQADPYALLPRGDVRPEDLREFRAYVPITEDEMVLRLRRGDEELFRQEGVVGSDARDETRSFAIVPIPPEVVARLRPGDVLTWSLERTGDARGAKPIDPATFTMVAADPRVAQRLARIDAELPGAPEVAGVLKAGVLLKAGLAVAAFREAREVSRRPAARDKLLPIYLQYEALRSLHVDTQKDGEDLAARLQGSTPEAKRRFEAFFASR